MAKKGAISAAVVKRLPRYYRFLGELKKQGVESLDAVIASHYDEDHLAGLIGVLEVFDNARLPVDYLAGTSMGSVVGGFYAAGLPSSELWELGEHITLKTITPDFNAMGLLRFLFARKLPTSANLSKFFEEHLGDKQIEAIMSKLIQNLKKQLNAELR